MMKVSVIVPVYKVEKYLDKCVESVVNQTYKNLEIILVDDGSPDKCPQMCDEWAKKDERIKVVHKQNGGLSSARNAGIEIAKGEFLMFVDSDDTINPQMIEILIRIQSETSSDITMCSWKKVHDINNPKNKTYDVEKLVCVVYENDEVFALLYNKKVPLIMAAWAKIYKRNLFTDVRYPEGKIHEDEAVIHEILNNCKKLSFIDYPMYNNTQRRDSITATTFNVKRLVMLEIMKGRIDFMEKNKPQFIDSAIHHYVKILILYYHYVKWAKMSQSILNQIKAEIDQYCAQGYTSKITKMFYKFPIILDWVLRIREKII
ncbi:MAG: glycosyltransferase [Clostridiales bacterium]|nr:glycosyltransferase [Clostridiales bacterium]